MTSLGAWFPKGSGLATILRESASVGAPLSEKSAETIPVVHRRFLSEVIREPLDSRLVTALRSTPEARLAAVPDLLARVPSPHWLRFGFVTVCGAHE